MSQANSIVCPACGSEDVLRTGYAEKKVIYKDPVTLVEERTRNLHQLKEWLYVALFFIFTSI